MQQTLLSRNAFSPVVIMGGGDGEHSCDNMGIVTVHDGISLQEGEIIAFSVGEEHASFQDPGKSEVISTMKT